MSTAFDLFSPQQWRVLQALGLYRFLTVDQILRLGISKNDRSLRDKSLFALRYYKAIHSERIAPFLPDVHHLTQRGADLLCEIEGIELGAAPGHIHSGRQVLGFPGNQEQMPTVLNIATLKACPNFWVWNDGGGDCVDAGKTKLKRAWELNFQIGLSL